MLDKTFGNFCFNRYMVECELSLSSPTQLAILCFNRYMVECEYKFIGINVVDMVVLIDTWWNVNVFR